MILIVWCMNQTLVVLPCNVLAMLSNLQKRTAFIGKVGDDFLGHALQQRIVRMGISTEGLSKDKKRNTTLAF